MPKAACDMLCFSEIVGLLLVCGVVVFTECGLTGGGVSRSSLQIVWMLFLWVRYGCVSSEACPCGPSGHSRVSTQTTYLVMRGQEQVDTLRHNCNW